MNTLHRSRHRGFSLVELLLAVGIVVMLAGLTVTAGSAMAERASRRSTQTTIDLLDHALREWEIVTQRKLSWGPDERRADVWSQRAHVLVLPEMLTTLSRVAASNDILAKIPSAHLHRIDPERPSAWYPYDGPELHAFAGRLAIVDDWGVPVYATHPGARPLSGGQVDDDGTEFTLNESLYGRALHRQVCFISAGPDRHFGLPQEFVGLNGAALRDAIETARADNLYSYLPDYPVFVGQDERGSGADG